MMAEIETFDFDTKAQQLVDTLPTVGRSIAIASLRYWLSEAERQGVERGIHAAVSAVNDAARAKAGLELVR